jgi:hypothetical protein
MLTLVSWQSATRAADANPVRPRKLALSGMMVGIVGCILTHYLGIAAVGIPLLFGETVRLYSKRRPDWPLAATAILSAMAALAVSVPMIHRTSRLLLVHLPRVTGNDIAERLAFAKSTLPSIIDANLVELLVGVIFILWTPRFLNRLRRKSRPGADASGFSRVAPHILAAAVGMVLLIPITFFLMVAEHGWYFCRYGIGSIVGIAMLACFLLARRDANRSGFVICLLVYLTVSYVRGFIHNARSPRGYAVDSMIYEDKSNLPIVISDPLLYPAIWWYAPNTMKDRIIYLSGTPTALPGGYALVEAALVSEKPLIPDPLQNYKSFVPGHDHFLLDTGPIDADLKETFEEAGYKVDLLRSAGTESLYDVRRHSVAP